MKIKSGPKCAMKKNPGKIATEKELDKLELFALLNRDVDVLSLDYYFKNKIPE